MRDNAIRLVVVASAALVTACSGGAPPPSPPSPPPVTLSATTAPDSTPGPTAAGAECTARAGAEVTDLPDVHAPEVVVPGDSAAGVPATRIPAVDIDGGCIIRYDAPGGCVGAVEVTGVRIPELRIPELVVPAWTRGSISLREKRFPAVVIPGAESPAVRTEQVCQEAVEDRLPTVTRPGIVRAAAVRNGNARKGGERPGGCADDACVPTVVVPRLAIEPVRVPSVDIDPVRLTRQRLAGNVDVLEGGDRVSYVAPADVLFDVDSARLLPTATEALREVARRLPTSGPVIVEGHTDDTNTAAYNLDLSRKRADAVAARLASLGVARDRISVVPRGETVPAHPNDSAAHRQLNRRVVITAPARG